MKNNIIQLNGIEKAYKNVKVLKGVNLEVAQGGIFALLGSNGSGKTTTIRIMTTLLKADAGHVVINGFDIEKNPKAIRGSISLTGQFAAIDEILTGRENLIMIAILHDGKIIAQDTLEGLKKLMPPAKVEYVEKQPTLEEVFLSIIVKREAK